MTDRPTPPPGFRPPSRHGPVIPYAGPVRRQSTPAFSTPGLPPEPPAPPRILSSFVRRRSLSEPKVRFWIIATGVLLATAAVFFVDQYRDFRRQQRLISRGVKVAATIDDVDGDARRGKRCPPGLPCTLVFQYAGKTVRVSGILSGTDYVTIGSAVPLFVDPADPANWTDRSAAEPLGRRMIAAVVFLPLLILTTLFAWRLRRRALTTWRGGTAYAYLAHDVRSSALAPRSSQVRCAAATGASKRLVTVYVPNSRGPIKSGDLLWLIHPPAKPNAAIAALSFQDKA